MKPLLTWFDSRQRFTWVWWVGVAFSALWLTQSFWYNDLRFAIWPVATMKHSNVVKHADGVLVDIGGIKHRGIECEYIDTVAYGDRLPPALPVDLYIDRVDKAADGKTRPAGKYAVGTYFLRPLGYILSARVYALHKCGDTRWSTKIAHIDFTKKEQ